jgi:hypothetical protein
VKLRGSCHCGKVSFSVDSETPYPFMYCYCSICRKLSGGPFGCNIMGKRDTLKLKGEKHLRCYHAIIREPGKRTVRSDGERWFCGECGTHLYVMDDRWPEGVWPNAAVIDTPLPAPPEYVHLMLRYKPEWVQVAGEGPRFSRYPKLSIAEWHEKHGVTGSPSKTQRTRSRRATRTP